VAHLAKQFEEKWHSIRSRKRKKEREGEGNSGDGKHAYAVSLFVRLKN